MNLLEDKIDTPLIQNVPSTNYTQQPIQPMFDGREVIDLSFCCFHRAYFPTAKLTLCNHWIFKPMKPIIISIIFLAIYCSFLYNIIAFKEEGKPLSPMAIIAILLYTIIFFFLIVSYFGIIIQGPGYLPFDYAIHHKTDLTWEEQKATFAIFKQEVDFARENNRPPRSSFSFLARRFVLRADHYCVWTESWIGLRNYRYFLLMTLYAFLFAFLYIISLHWRASYLYNHNDKMKIIHYISLCVPILVTLFIYVVMYLSLTHFLEAFVNLSHNVTGIELYKATKENKKLPVSYDKGCFKNFSEVCGPKKYCPLWVIPIACLNPTIDGLYTNYVAAEEVKQV